MKKYMVIEKFKADCFNQVYLRLEREGRMLPEGLYYIDSWVSQEENICFQLMQTKNKNLFQEWFKNWNDLVDFSVIPLDNTQSLDI